LLLAAQSLEEKTGHMQTKPNGNKSPLPQFNYDLERMKRCVESETVYIPRSESRQRGDIRKWLLAQ